MVQWLETHLEVRGTRCDPWSGKTTCCRAARPVLCAHHNQGPKRGREQASPVLHLDPVSHVNNN